MLYRILFTLSTAACITGLYTVYAIVVRPLVIVPELPLTSIEPAKHALAHRPGENVRVAETYISELRWAAKSQYMFRAGQAFIYTNEWSHEGKSQWITFAPFAMVWLQKDDQGQEQAVSLVSDSAQLKFASPFDTINPNPGRVIGAVLDGTVQVRGPNGLAIVGKQFIFDESAPSLVSTYPVQFQYGEHSGSGRSLHAKLIPAEGPPGKDRPHVYGIRTIRLDSGNELTVKKSSPPKFMHARLDLRVPQQDKTKLVHIHCSRDFEIDVPSQSITFTKEVRAHSPVGATGWDKLECDELVVELQPAGPGAAGQMEVEVPSSKSEAGSDFQRLPSNLEFKRMTARGRTVKVASTQNHLHASMAQLVYDAAERRLKMTDPKDVYVLQKQSKLSVPEVEVVLKEDNSLKEVWCRGKGRLEMTRGDTNELAFVATWARMLRKSTDATTGLDLIELHQKAQFRQPGQHTGLGAELIRLWIEPLPLSMPNGDSSGGGKVATAEPEPRRLVAERDVALVSPQIIARTSELDVQFEYAASPRELSQLSRDDLQLVAFQEQREPTPIAPRRPKPNAGNVQMSVPTTKPPSPKGTSLLAKAAATDQGSLGPRIDIPDSAEPERSSDRTPKPAAKAEPLDVTADRIAVRMRRLEGEAQPEMAEVETQGHVKVSQRRPAGEAPLSARGDRLLIQNGGRSRETVHLFGNPAHLRDRGLHIEGREVHLDRAANRVWVKGNGLLQLPVPAGSSIASLGEATSDPDLDVWWEESMEFDGGTARFVGKVLAELGLSKMWCEQMDVSLTSTISFSESAPDVRPGLKSIHCREDVSFQSSQMKGATTVQILRGRVAEFIHDHEHGTSQAQGPGQMVILQRRKSNEGTQPGQKILANRPLTAISPEWDYSRINFKGRMTGNIVMYADESNIDKQRSIFHDSVSMVHGPVNLPNETIDPDRLPKDSVSMRCEKLEFSHHSRGPNGESYRQLIGWGNARIEGHGFFANADEISYDGSKGLFILRAHGNQNSTIAQESAPGKRSEASGRRIEFIPALKWCVVDRVTGATGQ